VIFIQKSSVLLLLKIYDGPELAQNVDVLSIGDDEIVE
jgi:hypothetical protein